MDHTHNGHRFGDDNSNDGRPRNDGRPQNGTAGQQPAMPRQPAPEGPFAPPHRQQQSQQPGQPQRSNPQQPTQPWPAQPIPPMQGAHPARPGAQQPPDQSPWQGRPQPAQQHGPWSRPTPNQPYQRYQPQSQPHRQPAPFRQPRPGRSGRPAGGPPNGRRRNPVAAAFARHPRIILAVAGVLLVVAVVAAIAIPRMLRHDGARPTESYAGTDYAYAGVKELSAFEPLDLSYIKDTPEFSQALGSGIADSSAQDDAYAQDAVAEIYTDPRLNLKIDAEYDYLTKSIVPSETMRATLDINDATMRIQERLRAEGKDDLFYMLAGSKDMDQANKAHDDWFKRMRDRSKHGDAPDDPYQGQPDRGKTVHGWFHHPRYWVVLHFDGNGRKLERPEVLQINVKEHGLAAPEPLSATIDDQGWLSLSWKAVKGAKQYAIAVFNKRESEPTILDIADGNATSWSAARAPIGDSNSPALMATDINGDQLKDKDRTDADSRYLITQNGAVGVGVIAMNDDFASAPAYKQLIGKGVSAGSDFASLAVGEFTFNSDSETGWDRVNSKIYRLPDDAGELLADIASYPQTVPYVAADGSLRNGSTQALAGEIAPASKVLVNSFLGRPDQYRIDAVGGPDTLVATLRFYAAGTRAPKSVEHTLVVPSADYDIAGLLRQYNTDSLKRSAQTGMVVQSVSDNDLKKAVEQNKVDRKKAEVKPDTPLNQFTDKASGDPLVQFIMAKFSAGEGTFPVDQFKHPGEQDEVFAARATDAAAMAWYQNSFAYDGGTYGPSYYAGNIVAIVDKDKVDTVSAAADQAIAEIKPSGSDADKIKQINDWITGKVEYDYAAYQMGQERPVPIYLPAHNAWDGFEHGKVVCDGYASMFHAIAMKAGLQTMVVTGHTSQGGHAWNVVKVDGKWRTVDCTWNDSPPATSTCWSTPARSPIRAPTTPNGSRTTTRCSIRSSPTSAARCRCSDE